MAELNLVDSLSRGLLPFPRPVRARHAPCASILQSREIHFGPGERPWEQEGVSRATWYRRTRPILPPDDSFRWYCLRTDHHAESQAEQALRLESRHDGHDIGWPLFAPRLFRKGKPAHTDSDGRSRRATEDRFIPLFLRFIFVRLNLSDPDWGRIPHLPGVDKILGCERAHGHPQTVPDEAIEAVRSLPGYDTSTDTLYEKGLHGPKRSYDPLKAGQLVRVLTGSMVDLTGICEWSDSKRVTLLMQIMGRPTKIRIDRADVGEA